jgi:hypothetical protein
LIDLLRALPSLGRLKYIEICSGLNCSNSVYLDPTQILARAKVTPASPTRGHSFLVTRADQEIFTREILRADGSGRITVADQNQNWNSVVIALGGEAGDRTLVMSDINTVGETEEARDLHRQFKALVRSLAMRVGPKGKPALLMPGAIRKAKEGWRLSRNPGWASSTDLSIAPDELAAL